MLSGSERAVLSGSEGALQRVGSTDFRSTTETRFGKLKRFWKFYLTAGLDLDFHRIHTVLSGLDEADNEGTYPAFLSDLYVTPQADYERNGWRLSFYSPLKWYHYAVRGSHDYLSAGPGVSVRKQLTSKSEVLGSVGYYLGAPQAYLNIDAPFLEDYRNLFVACAASYGCSGFGGGSYGCSGFGEGSYGCSGFGEGASDCGAVKSCRIDKYSNDVNASLSYRYRNPLRSLFVNLSASYRHSRSGIMSNQLFIEDFIVSTYAERVMNSDTWQVKGGMSKGLGHSKMVVGVEAEASTTSAASMRNNEVIGYRQGSVGVKPYFKGSIVRCLSVNYEAEYGASRLKMGGDRGVASLGKAVEETVYHTLRQNLFATFLPVDRVEFTVGGEHYFTRFPEGNTANLVLLDASAVWRINGRIRLSVTANNLLNQKIYSYVSYGTLSRSESRFQLRGRTILASLQFRF